MAEDGIRYVVCYDIADNRRRTRLAELLDGFGDRVQESIFEAVLDQTLYQHLVDEMTRIIDPRYDGVVIYGLCAACTRRRVGFGTSERLDLPGENDVFIV